MWSYFQYKTISKDVESAWACRNQQPLGRAVIRSSGPVARISHRVPVETEGEPSSDKVEKHENVPQRDGIEATDEQSDEKKKHTTVEVTDINDSFDPRNWSLLTRSSNIAILALLISVQAWVGATDSVANSAASTEFGVSKVAQNLSTAMYLFGIGSGCMVVGPLSEMIGRNPTYLIFTFCFLFFVLGSALAKTFGGYIVCRYFIGLCASATLGINGASVKDQFRPVKRSFVYPLIAWANVAPPVIAPIVGGWVISNSALHWRWTIWVTLIISGFAFVTALFLLPETYLPMLLSWKAKHLRRVTGNQEYASKHDEDASFATRLKQIPSLSASFICEPVLVILGGYLVLLYVLLFTFLSGFEYIFKKTHNLSDGQYGSCFASIALGATAFTLTAPGLYSWARHHTEHVQGAKVLPEFRLWPAIIAAPVLPASLFWLGWTSNPGTSIWSSLAACFFFGMVLIAIYASAYEYIIDSYGDHAAVALATITMFRYMIAGGMVMAARPMFEKLGVHWTMTLLGCIATVLVPGPLLLKIYGKRLRKKSPYAE